VNIHSEFYYCFLVKNLSINNPLNQTEKVCMHYPFRINILQELLETLRS
jgi:hypothetical protein